MQRLSEHDVSRLLTFVSELRTLDDPLPFPPRLLAVLQTLIAADDVTGMAEARVLLASWVSVTESFQSALAIT